MFFHQNISVLSHTCNMEIIALLYKPKLVSNMRFLQKRYIYTVQDAIFVKKSTASESLSKLIYHSLVVY